MQIDEVKLARQEQGVDKWFENNCQGILDYHTGVGKTFTASLAIKRLEKLQPSTFVVVVPSPELEIQWNRKLSELLYIKTTDRIVVKTMHKILSENLTYETGTLIVDEIHEFVTEERLKILDGSIIKYERFLGLTASGDDKRFRMILRYHKIIDYISKEEATEKGYVADFIEYNLGLDLTLRERELYDNYTNIMNKHMPKFENNIQFAHFVLVGGKANTGIHYSGVGWAWALAHKKGWKPDLDLTKENNRKINDLWHPNLFIGYAKSLINAVRLRRELLCNATAKYNTTLEIMNKFNKVKTILFSESTQFADKIGIILNDNKHPTVVYHSKLKTTMATSPISGKFIKMGQVRLKREALDKIRRGLARILSTARSLDKGLDVEDLRMSITTSGSQNPTQYKQRSGRSTRKEDNIFADLPVLLINLYIVDTQDEIWLKNRQENNRHSPILITSVDEITYTPAPNTEFTLLDL